MSPRTPSLGCDVPRGPQNPNYELPIQHNPIHGVTRPLRTLTLRRHPPPVLHVPSYSPRLQLEGALSPLFPSTGCPIRTTCPPYLSDGDSTPKSKLSSVTNRTSGGTLGVSPAPSPHRPRGEQGGHAALALPYLGPRPSPRGTGATCGSWGVTTDRIEVPHPCPYPPPVSPTPRGGPVAPASARLTRPVPGAAGLGATGMGTGMAPPAPVGGGDTGDPARGALSATMGGPSPAAQH